MNQLPIATVLRKSPPSLGLCGHSLLSTPPSGPVRRKLCLTRHSSTSCEVKATLPTLGHKVFFSFADMPSTCMYLPPCSSNLFVGVPQDKAKVVSRSCMTEAEALLGFRAVTRDALNPLQGFQCSTCINAYRRRTNVLNRPIFWCTRWNGQILGSLGPGSSEYTGEEKNHGVYLECTYANILVDMFDGAGQVVCARNGGGEGGDEPSPPAPGTNMFVTSRAPLLRL